MVTTAVARVLGAASAVGLGACGGASGPVSSTTTAHKVAEHAPAPPDQAQVAATGETPLPAFDDPNERIVYLRAGSVFMMAPAGGPTAPPERISLRDARAPDEAPALSPHGDAVVYVSLGSGSARVMVAAPGQSGAPRAVTDGSGGGDGAPAWAPDGRTLVFVRGAAQKDLMLVDFDGSGQPKRLLEGKDLDPQFAGAPAWSPDGRWIVFAADRGQPEGTGLWLIAPDGTGLRRLTRPARVVRWVRDGRPAWTPDGKAIVFQSNRDVASEDQADDTDLYRVEVATGKITRLTQDPGRASDPTVSPDGRRIYFVSTRDASRDWSVELYAMPVEGGEQRRMTRDEVPQNAAPSAGRVL